MPFPGSRVRWFAANAILLLVLIASPWSHLRLDAQAPQNVRGPATAEGPREIFDGTFDGWEGDWKHWRIEQGTIVGEIAKGQTLRKNTWLVWRGAELKDFDLRLQFRISGLPAANSGIQIRCQVDGIDHVSGYQADLDMGSTWLGRLYDEHGRAMLVERGERVKILPDGKRLAKRYAPLHQYPVLFRENQWNDYRIVAIGERIDVYVNGTLFSQLWDQQTDQKDLAGSLALQLHSGPETRIAFREITVETLSEKDVSRLAKFELPDESATVRPEQQGVRPVGPDNQPLNLGFELGTLKDWQAVGNAFDKQPVNQDGISKRWPDQTSNKEGDFFIGGFEIVQDPGTGTLQSATFQVTHPYAGFLFGGGQDNSTRAEVVLHDASGAEAKVIAKASGDNREQMRRVAVDLRDHQGATISVRLVDENPGGWGHLNFDDFRFFDAPPAASLATDTGPRSTFNVVLHTLVPNKTEPPLNSVAANKTLQQMFVPEGFSVDLIASEPEVHQPIAFAFDPQGRLWVLEGHSYPQKRPDGQGLDRIVIFADADGDGRFENRKVFIEGLNLASGIEVGHGGVWVGAAPQLLFIPDRDGDDSPDGPAQVLLDGFGFGDTHETLNSFVWGPDGWLYGTQGVFNTSSVGQPESNEPTGTAKHERVHLAAGVWRYDPIGHRFEVFAHGTSNPWGLDYDEHGQFFMTHCRSFWGKGGTTHVMHGGHYWNQVNSGYAPFISNIGVPTAPHLQNFLLASARYDSGEGGAGRPGTGEIYGGHSHVGTVIYLGDNWPSEYRNHLLTHNLHGHQLNHQINRREAGGYDSIHAGNDLFLCADPAFVGVDLAVGPDGALYMSDWVDTRHCHNPGIEQWDRGNGRIYRMKYDANYKPNRRDWTGASDGQLVEAMLLSDDWHVRAARLVLAGRYSGRPVPPAIADSIRKLGRDGSSNSPLAVRHRLCALWMLATLRAVTDEDIAVWLADADEVVRGWAVRLLDRSDSLPELAAKETSLMVRRELALAAGRLGGEAAWPTLATLSLQDENAQDRDLPVVLWQSIGKLWSQEGAPAEAKALAIARSTPLVTVRDGIRWYAAKSSDSGRNAIVADLPHTDEDALRHHLEILEHALRGENELSPSDAWKSVAPKLYASNNPVIRNLAESIGAQMGDAVLFDVVRKRLAVEKSNKDRLQAMEVLRRDRSPENLPLLLETLDEPQLAAKGLAMLRAYDDPTIGNAVIERFGKFTPDASAAALDLLTSRKSLANGLLDALASQRIDRSALTAYYARQMTLLNDDQLNSRIAKEWGQVRSGDGAMDGAMKEQIRKTTQAYRGAPLWAFDAGAGKRHFDKLCASCHSPADQRIEIAPKLQGTGAKGIDYAIENLIDPNAVIGKDYQARVIRTTDGQVITGLVQAESDKGITIRTATETIEVDKSAIEELKVSENSFMPTGLLDTLDERQRIELLKYLLTL